MLESATPPQIQVDRLLLHPFLYSEDRSQNKMDDPILGEALGNSMLCWDSTLATGLLLGELIGLACAVQ
jgi:hypothetical protein